MTPFEIQVEKVARALALKSGYRSETLWELFVSEATAICVSEPARMRMLIAFCEDKQKRVSDR